MEWCLWFDCFGGHSASTPLDCYLDGEAISGEPQLHPSLLVLVAVARRGAQVEALGGKRGKDTYMARARAKE